jgi:hypothetical protein
VKIIGLIAARKILSVRTSICSLALRERAEGIGPAIVNILISRQLAYAHGGKIHVSDSSTTGTRMVRVFHGSLPQVQVMATWSSLIGK